MWLLLALLAILSALILAVRLLIKPKANGIYAVLGSGGHTGEMLRIIDGLDNELRPTHFIVGIGDKLSLDKLASIRMKHKQIISISRPRNVGQSYVTSVFTTLRTAFECLNLFKNSLPKLVISFHPSILCLSLRLYAMGLAFVS